MACIGHTGELAVNLRAIKPSSIKLVFEVCISQKIREKE